MAAPNRAPGAPLLLLVPTEPERRRFLDLGGLPPGHALQALVGFGPIAAAARTAQWLERVRPARVVLFGIAGTYDTERLTVGTAVAFDRVALDGVGVGQGNGFLGPPALGFPQWPGDDGSTPRIDDALELSAPAASEPALLLTTCAASADAEQAEERRARHPSAAAEDMEGFGVALACALAGVPCTIVRGLSNRVGDRDPTHWRIPAALSAARRLLLECLARDRWRSPAGGARA